MGMRHLQSHRRIEPTISQDTMETNYVILVLTETGVNLQFNGHWTLGKMKMISYELRGHPLLFLTNPFLNQTLEMSFPKPAGGAGGRDERRGDGRPPLGRTYAATRWFLMGFFQHRLPPNFLGSL